MKNSSKSLRRYTRRVAVFCLALTTISAILWSDISVTANHPVLVEGNCDSPVPGTTLVTSGTCGDYDGDGRIGTAEDTDGADRIFGTLRAALGPGTGAAAGTGANHNGRIIIVASGRYAETLYIGNSGFIPGEGVANPGNVTIEAAPGVEANLDAVLQGDPAGGNVARQGAAGITIVYTATDRVVTLRNLVIRNFGNGIGIALNSRLHVDHCRFEGNISYGIRAIDNTRIVISNSQFDSAGFRIGGPTAVPSPGTAISIESNAQARIEFTNISNSAGAGINNLTGIQGNVGLFKVSTYFNNPNIAGVGVVTAPSSNFAQ